ncbi:MAG: motility associated factor glycosyltransferase family protein [Sulfurimonas sp.]|nr:motility associated factor glycosyltransferase family protein [Sulfurimonas sp.]
MQNIEAQVEKNYLTNIEYIKKSHPSVYDKILALEDALDKGYYTQRYEIEYENGFFNVVELQSDVRLYSTDSKVHAKAVADSVNHKKNENVLETFIHREFSQRDVDHYTQKSVSESSYAGIIPIVDYANKIAHKDKTTMMQIYKFVFLGVGLGLHIETVHKKIKAKNYLIIEDDLELFRLSLFTTNYTKIAKEAKLFFWIFDDEKHQEIISDFLSDLYIYNHFIKFYQMHHHQEIKFKNIQTVIATQSHLSFTYTALLKQLSKPLKLLADKRRFINISSKPQNTIFSQKPLLLIAAGPSLKKHIQWLKENHNRFIVMAVSASLSLLYKEGITPDIVTHVDGFEASLAHYKDIDSKNYLAKTVTIFSSSVLQEHIDLINDEHLFIYQNITQFKENFGSIVAPCVGSQSFGLSLNLNVKELYLLGLDLALDQKTGATHTEEHIQSKKLDLEKTDIVEDTFTMNTSTVQTQGNFQEKVTTTSNFLISINNINLFTTQLQTADQKTYNLNDGAHFNKTIPTSVDSIDMSKFEILNKENIHNDICSSLKNISQRGLSDSEYKNLESLIEDAQEKKAIIQKFQTAKITANVEKYKSRFSSFMDNILPSANNIQTNSITLIYLFYIKYIVTYLFDILNTKELEHPKKHIQLLTENITRVLIEIEDKYEEILKEAIDKK